MAEREGLLARYAELTARARGGSFCHTAFLTPAELLLFARASARMSAHTVTWGGYAGAERQRVFFLPDYAAEAEPDVRQAMLAEEYAAAVVPVRVEGSGYRELTHRDFLGAVLGLGVERDALGDLLVLSPHEAVFFTSATLAAFFAEHLTTVGADTVHAAPVSLPPDFDGGIRTATLTGTVPSPRADAVVAELCGLSREQAREMIVAGLVAVDYEPEKKPDRPLAAGQVVTVRGRGKFTLLSLTEPTKKGRLRLVAEKRL